VSARPQAVILDLGGVVFPIDVARPIRRWAAAAGCSPQELLERVREHPVHERFERGEMTPGEFRDHVRAELGLVMDDVALDSIWNDIYLDPWPEMEPLLGELRRTARLAALSNTNAIHVEHVHARYGHLLAGFERVFYSHELGLRKPEPACFEAVLAALGQAPEHALYVDDDARNVEAALSVGIRAFRATDPGQLSAGLRRHGVLS
jgi:putative hydrolase of the HAD superfamily